MTSKLKCTFCEYELQENGTTNLCCPICGLVAPTKLWQTLIQAKQDLDFFIKEQVRTQTALIERTKELDKCQKDLKKANAELDYIKEQVEKSNALYNARNAVKAIDHIADVSKMV